MGADRPSTSSGRTVLELFGATAAHLRTTGRWPIPHLGAIWSDSSAPADHWTLADSSPWGYLERQQRTCGPLDVGRFLTLGLFGATAAHLRTTGRWPIPHL